MILRKMTLFSNDAPIGNTVPRGERKRILVVNAFLDEYQRHSGSHNRVPRAMGPVYLAGAFARDLCDVRIFNEQYSGVLHDTRLLGWPDMLVLTGVTSSFDRMLHLTAYARTLNEKVVVVAGGPAVRALPHHARKFFDYACLGDIEELQAVAATVFGPNYAAADMFPRYDLAPPSRYLGYAESSRACNFRCSFCSLTGEKARYRTYDLDFVRRQIAAIGRKHIVFIDNNFYGNDRDFFRQKVGLLRDMHRGDAIKGWSCLVTGDFFARPENLQLVRDAGCQFLFSGVESFDENTLRSYNKRQNTLVPQVQMIRDCLDAGVFFAYGMMMDPSARRLADLRAEIEFILGCDEIPLPAFFTLAIPLLGTPYFRECLARGLFFPHTRLRNLDGVTLTLRPLDPIPEVVDFASGLPRLRGYRGRVAAHTARFLRRYRRRLSWLQLCGEVVNAMLVSMEAFATSPGLPWADRPARTFFGPTEILDSLYTPVIRVPSRYEGHFHATQVTDEKGALAEDLAEDLG